MKVAIHQPNFMPWTGYFYKLLQADIFVFFDQVQFPRGKSYCSRVKIKSPTGSKWLTVPVSGKGKLLPIKDVQIAGDAWVKKHLGTLRACYGKAPFFADYFPGIERIFTSAAQYIADFNIQLITYFAAALGARAKFIRASELNSYSEDTGENLPALVRSLGGSTYITGQGAGTSRHLDVQKFEQADIKVKLIEYVDTAYTQQWEGFIEGLSVADILFNTGTKARHLILSGGKETTF